MNLHGHPKENNYLSWGKKLPENKWCELVFNYLRGEAQTQLCSLASSCIRICWLVHFQTGAIPWELVDCSGDVVKVDFTSFELLVWSIWAEGMNEVPQWPRWPRLPQSHPGRCTETGCCNCLAEVRDAKICREGMIQATKGYRAS